MILARSYVLGVLLSQVGAIPGYIHQVDRFWPIIVKIIRI